jgi:crotonobetainyl-CoA:carnitine CoA-transferase CaiB-like acyl-CoA transferase
MKIENPDGGDHFRSFRGALYSPQFIAYNKNKRSATIDLRSDAGKAMLWELIDNADVLLDNFRYGVMDRLGFSWEALHARNPRLIFCSITGFGAEHPSSGPHRRGADRCGTRATDARRAYGRNSRSGRRLAASARVIAGTMSA